MKKMIQRIDTLTQEQLKDPTENSDTIMLHLLEELGEYSTAKCLEDGSNVKGYKTLDESSMSEAVDLSICALSLFFSRGGDIKTLKQILNKKLDKWESKLP